MEIELVGKSLTINEKLEIEALLARKVSSGFDDLEQIWFLMDSVWDKYGCDNLELNWERIGQFYSDSVWLLNGLFIEQDVVSMGHRHAISNWVKSKGFSRVVDYGGGFGTLARLVAEKSRNSIIDIYEPHPSEFGIKRAAKFKNINMQDKLGCNYDVLLSTDVLEHVADPLADFSTMIDSVRIGGYLVVANCFHPVIKCHLPQNFHFRFTFDLFSKLMGLKRVGLLSGSHATVYKKEIDSNINWGLIRKVEIASKLLFPLVKFMVFILRPVKRFIFR